MYTRTIFSLVFLGSLAISQTIDYFPKSFTGDMSTNGGAGYAIIKGANALQLNPSGLSVEKNSNEILLNVEAKYYSYHLLNYLHNRRVGRTFYHDKIKPTFPQFSSKFQLNNKIAIGIGLVNFLTPYINNSKKAVTWSPLYTQITKGNIYSIILVIGYAINDQISIGMNISNNWGTIVSSIEGDNHYTDLGKTLEVEASLKSVNMNLGAQVHFKTIDFGINITTPNKFRTDVTHTISSDSLFKALIPTGLNQSIEYPWNFGFGIATKVITNWEFLFDLKTYNVSDSDFSFNITGYESGGSKPSNVNIYVNDT